MSVPLICSCSQHSPQLVRDCSPDYISRVDVLLRLRELPWFATLDPALLSELAERGRLIKCPVGGWLWGEGDEDTGIAAVFEGGLYLYAQTQDEGETLFSFLPRGGVLGQSRLFGGGPRLVTAIGAMESLIFLAPDRALRDAAADHPSLWPHLSALVYEQLREALKTIVSFAALKPRERLIARLLQLSIVERRVPVSQAALAEMIGASRNAVNAWLGQLEQEGAIVRRYGAIEVLRRRDLRRLLTNAHR